MPHPDCLQHEFDPDQLQRFDPALVYGFNSEGRAGRFEQTDATLAQDTFHITGQFEDMLAAYRYAEQVILPEIKRVGIANITVEQFLLWLDQLHERIAYTLAEEYQDPDVQAGRYSLFTPERWKRSQHERKFFTSMLRHQSTLPSLEQVQKIANKSLQLFALEEASEDEIKDYIEKAWQFSHVLYAVKERQDIQLSESVIALLEKDHTSSIKIVGKREADTIKKIDTVWEKLFAAYHQDKLTAKQRRIVDSMLTICLPPEKMRAAMEAFAASFLKQWATCDRNDPEAVADLATNCFKGIAGIHAYFNANGRLATCDMNIVLVSLDWPSILLRKYGERDDPNSSYSQAIAAIKTQPELLRAHIKERLQEAREVKIIGNKPAAHPLGEYVKQQVRFQRLGLAARAQGISLQEIDNVYNEANAFVIQEMRKSFPDQSTLEQYLDEGRYKEPKVATDAFRLACDGVAKAFQTLRSTPAVTPKVVQRSYTEEQIEKILVKLKDITGVCDGWKAYKKGTVILLTLSPEETQSADNLVKTLNERQALEAKKMRHSKTGQTVVQVTHVNFEKLLETPLPTVTAPDQRQMAASTVGNAAR